MTTIVGSYFTIVYLKKGGGNISFGGGAPFVVPHIGSSVDIEHNGRHVVGKVDNVIFKDDTFETMGGFGSRSLVEVYVS